MKFVGLEGEEKNKHECMLKRHGSLGSSCAPKYTSSERMKVY